MSGTAIHQKFKPGDQVWAFSVWGHGCKPAEVRERDERMRSDHPYSILVFGFEPSSGLDTFGAYEWQLFPRGDGPEQSIHSEDFEADKA